MNKAEAIEYLNQFDDDEPLLVEVWNVNDILCSQGTDEFDEFNITYQEALDVIAHIESNPPDPDNGINNRLFTDVLLYI